MRNPELRPLVALDNISLHYRVKLNPAQARRAAWNAENRRPGPWRLRRLIRKIDRIIPRMDFGTVNGEPNPNNGHPHHWYEFGREYSRVLYVNIVHAYLKTDPAQLAEKIISLAEFEGADEAHATTDPGRTVIRLWWD